MLLRFSLYYYDGRLIASVYPKRGSTSVPIGSLSTPGGDIASGEGSVWATMHDVPLTRIDIESNKAVQQRVRPGGLQATDGIIWGQADIRCRVLLAAVSVVCGAAAPRRALIRRNHGLVGASALSMPLEETKSGICDQYAETIGGRGPFL